MPQNKDLKRLVRARMAETGERYTEALTHVLSLTMLERLPSAWFITGDRSADYEVGLQHELPSVLARDLIAGLAHDHLFVDWDHASRALDLLRAVNDPGAPRSG